VGRPQESQREERGPGDDSNALDGSSAEMVEAKAKDLATKRASRHARPRRKQRRLRRPPW
jgi:hypothetical protein